MSLSSRKLYVGTASTGALKIEDYCLLVEYSMLLAVTSCLYCDVKPSLHADCVPFGCLVLDVLLARGEKFYPSRLGGRKTRKMPLGLFRVFGQEEKLLFPRTEREAKPRLCADMTMQRNRVADCAIGWEV